MTFLIFQHGINIESTKHGKPPMEALIFWCKFTEFRKDNCTPIY